MKKKLITMILTVCLVMVFFIPTVLAAGESRVTIGADNTAEQLATVYGFFRIERNSIPELTVTNAEERQYLSGIAPEEKIGNVALSCAYIETKDRGGIELESYNINWVTDDMYVNALTTAGIQDAKVVVAAYKPVSGTGALAGIFKAYEDLTGEKLQESAKSVATEELVITSDLQSVLDDASPEFINDLKSKLALTKNMSDDEIRALIVETAKDYDAELTQDQIEQILGLIKKMNELDIDPDTFVNLVQAGQGVQGFFTNVGDFFSGVGDFFSNLFSGFGG